MDNLLDNTFILFLRIQVEFNKNVKHIVSLIFY